MARKAAKPKPKPVEIVDLSDESLQCRDLRHPWKRVNDYTLVKERGVPAVITRALRCPRCKTERFDTYAVPSFELLSSRTKYPPGYLAKGVGRHVRVADIRREQFTRLTGKAITV